ncbi:MAG TPA: hypothetical protein DD656_07765, partial [Alphaproteobacteria bacterium]|nr:hypothetical protein [Alphaproteobacteria bacterium]
MLATPMTNTTPMTVTKRRIMASPGTEGSSASVSSRATSSFMSTSPHFLELLADSPERLDKLLSAPLEDLSRNRIKSLILEGAVKIDGVVCTDPSRMVTGTHLAEILIPAPVDD